MKEGIKIFSEKNAKKLEDAVGEFLNNKNIVGGDTVFSVDGSPREFICLIRYSDYSDEPVSPKEKGNYKFKNK